MHDSVCNVVQGREGGGGVYTYRMLPVRMAAPQGHHPCTLAHHRPHHGDALDLRADARRCVPLRFDTNAEETFGGGKVNPGCVCVGRVSNGLWAKIYKYRIREFLQRATCKLLLQPIHERTALFALFLTYWPNSNFAGHCSKDMDHHSLGALANVLRFYRDFMQVTLFDFGGV